MEFSLAGVKIRIGFLFSWVVAVLLCFDRTNAIRPAVFFSLLHEAGHLSAIILTGQRPKQICFGLFGMSIVRGNDLSESYIEEMITALAGPAVNIILALVFALAHCFFDNGTVNKAFAVNLIIGLFNLMPVFSLDGGRALESFLKYKYDSFTSERILKTVSFFTLLLLDGLGIYVFVKSGYNFTLLIISLYLTVLLFVKC